MRKEEAMFPAILRPLGAPLRIALIGDAGGYNNRGAALLDRGRIDRAIEDLNEALRRNNRLRIAYLNRAAAFRGDGVADQGGEGGAG